MPSASVARGSTRGPHVRPDRARRARLDGRGTEPRTTDVAVSGDRIVAVGDLAPDEPAHDVPRRDGLVVCPGFVNPLSHSYLSVLEDGTSLGELVQGVTTQIFGEGESMGPVHRPAAPRWSRKLRRTASR